jgi:hypothetical protein
MLLVVIAGYVLLQSPFSPQSIHYPGSESSLYRYVGSQLLDGNMPYRDIFDFHAPLIFLINALGLLISEVVGVNGSTGIWVLEVLILAATLGIVFALLYRNTSPVVAFFVCLILLSLIGLSLQGGNHIEEYALFFQALALMGFVDCFTKRRLTLVSVYLIGLSAALIFCLKHVLIVFWVPFLLVIPFLLFRKESLGVALTRLITIPFSAMLVFIAIVPWLYVNNALASCYDQLTSFYQDYLSLATQQEQTNALRYFFGHLSFMLIVVISLMAVIKMSVFRHREKIKSEDGVTVLRITQGLSLNDSPFGENTVALLLTNLAATVLVFLTMAVPGRMDEYVVLQGLICLVIPLAYAFHLIERGLFNRAWPRVAFGLVVAVLLALFVAVPGFTASAALAREQQSGSFELDEQRELVNAIKGYQEYDEPLIVFGDDCWIYTAVDSYSATRYPYQPFSDEFRPDLNANFYRQIGIAEAALFIGRVDEGLIERYSGIDEYERVFENQRYEIYHRIESSSLQVE